jgi:hypothetical protein
VGLPPDLARLGNELVDAARRTTRNRRARRRRLSLAAVCGALAFAALTPAALTPADRELMIAAAERFPPPGCNLARAADATLVDCEGPMVLYRPYAIN